MEPIHIAAASAGSVKDMSFLVNARKCIFCGTAKPMATPIWPEWLNARCEEAGGHEQVVLSAPRSEAPCLTCDACADGWMAVLDRQAEQMLAPVLDGKQVVLSSGKTKMLAGWLCLLGVKLAAQRDTCITAPSERAHLRHTGQPSQNWAIFVAGLREAGSVRSCRHHPCRIEFSGNPMSGHSRGRPAAPCNSHMVSVGIGPLFFHLFSSPSLINVHDFAAASRRQGLTSLWPPPRRFGFLSSREIRLPPELTLTTAEASRISEGFAAQLATRVGQPILVGTA